jgi:hypothetical protein
MHVYVCNTKNSLNIRREEQEEEEYCTGRIRRVEKRRIRR